MNTVKEKLQHEAEVLLKQAKHASEAAQYAQGRCYFEEKQKADKLWAQYHEAVRKANECTC